MIRFYWLTEQALAGCSRPGGIERRGLQAPDGTLRPEVAGVLEADLAWLKDQGIGALLSMTELPLPEEALARYELKSLHLPVEDMTAPTPEQLMQALEFIDWQRAHGRSVAVHCLMGQGRTGTVLAAYLIRSGSSPEEALKALRALCPGAVENPVQERALQAFAERRDWIA